MIKIMENEVGLQKKVKVGFSWTLLFFGVLVPLIRGDLKWALIMFVLAFLTGGVSWLVFPFTYNKIYVESLIENGYKFVENPKSSININIVA